MALVADYDSSSSSSDADAAPRPAPLPAAAALLQRSAPPAAFLVQSSSRPEVDYAAVGAALARAEAARADAEAAADAAAAPPPPPPPLPPSNSDAASNDSPPLRSSLPAPPVVGEKRARPTGGAQGAGGGDRAGKPAAPRVSAKERVKQQRLAGQSGIGSDFRVWRSDDEMAQRQQFD